MFSSYENMLMRRYLFFQTQALFKYKIVYSL